MCREWATAKYRIALEFTAEHGWVFSRDGSEFPKPIHEPNFSVFADTLTYQFFATGNLPYLPVDRPTELTLDHIVRDRTVEAMTGVVTRVDLHIMWQLKDLADDAPCWSYEKLLPGNAEEMEAQLAMVFPEEFSKFANLEDYQDHLKFHRQEKTLRVIEFKAEEKKLTIQFEVEAKLVPYDKGRLCNCIPLPGKTPKIKPKKGLSVDSPEIVLASPLVEADLNRVSQVWQDHSAKSVLVCGPPGSGKENLTLSIPYGSGRNTPGIQALSLGECKLDQTLRRLFGFQKDDGSIAPGLIEQANKSALFVDEAHYPVKGTGARAALLRVLEAGTYYPVGSDKAKKVDKVLWLFASSRDLAGANSIGKLDPPDFWTRMSHVIQIRHPLDPVALEEQSEQGTYVQDFQLDALKRFFCFFWISSLEAYFGREIVEIPAFGDSLASDGSRSQTPKEIVVDRKVDRLLKNVIEMADAFAEHLMQEMGSHSLRQISVRGIRSMASQLLSHAIRAVEENEDEGETQKKEPKPAALKAVEENLSDVFKQLRQVASLAPKR